MRWATIGERVGMLVLFGMLMGVVGLFGFFDFLKPRVRPESFLRYFISL